MAKLVMMRGLPGSGKSTHAREQVKNSGGKVVRVNKDDLRASIQGGIHRKGSEGLIIDTRNAMIRLYLRKNLTVISDDTNLNPIHETALRSIAKECSAEFEIKDFTHVPLATCITQDLKRLESVGEGVIRTMYNQYLAPKAQWITGFDKNKVDTVIVDIDGTVAFNDGHRGFYDYSLVGGDAAHYPISDLVIRLIQTHQHITFVSGRDDSCMPETYNWLSTFIGPDKDADWNETWRLLMRKTGDKRQDAEVKLEILDNLITPIYNVLYAIDDRRQVIDAWRSRGITVLDVFDGRF